MMKYHKRLLKVAIVFALLSAGQLLDHVIAGQKEFKVVKGHVSDVKTSSFYSRSSRRSSRATYYTKTVIRVGESKKEYYAADKTDADSLLLKLGKGDHVEVYTRSWFQPLSYIGIGANMFVVKKDGTVIYDITAECKGLSKMYMWILAVMALFIYIIYLDVVKGISIEKWFQKYVLKNPKYYDK